MVVKDIENINLDLSFLKLLYTALPIGVIDSNTDQP